MKTFIAIPSMDQVAVQFCQSLAVLNKSGECGIGFKVGSLITESREYLALQAIQSGADYVMWFDSDMTFPPDTLERMQEHMKTYDIVSGIYFRRTPPYTPVLHKTLDIKEDGEGGYTATFSDYEDYPLNSVFEVEGIGFGCVMMKTDILRAVIMEYGTAFAMMGKNGEDCSFSQRVRNLGYHIMCDSSIKCGHVGHLTITEGLFRSMQKLKPE